MCVYSFRKRMNNAMRRSLCLLLAMPAGCFRLAPSINDPDPASKIPAIKAAVGHNDRHALPELVDSLDSDDPAIRFYAWDGLRKLSGQDFGYHFYDEADQRKPAVARWRQWLAQQPRS